MFRHPLRRISSRSHGYVCPSCRFGPLSRSGHIFRFESTVAPAIQGNNDAEESHKENRAKRKSKHHGGSGQKDVSEKQPENPIDHGNQPRFTSKFQASQGQLSGEGSREDLVSTLKELLNARKSEDGEASSNGDLVEIGSTRPAKQSLKRRAKGAPGRRRNGDAKLNIRRRPTRPTQMSKERPAKDTEGKAEDKKSSEQNIQDLAASAAVIGATTAHSRKDKLLTEVEGHQSLENALVGKLKRSSKKGSASVPKRVQAIEASSLHIEPVEVEQPPVPGVAHGLERVLFNPGVYQLQDPRSRVFNFDPYLKTIMPVAEFDFNALKEYVTSSKDEALKEIAQTTQKKYIGSSSSMTGALAHFHFLLSNWRPINANIMSQGFTDKLRSFTMLQRCPSAIFLRHRDGMYAIDADKEFDSANILSMLGKSMEKLLTLPKEEYERYRITNSAEISEAERNAPEAFHYSTMGDFLMRSQLDAHDPRLPGTGMFDLKTRAVVSIRMDSKNYENGSGYQIRGRHGEWESYEREYFDMIRSAFLKYSLQVRMGRMDGIFVAFHNTQRIFGFQYVPLSEMDAALHGQWDTCLGDQEFKTSITLLNQVLDRATQKFPGKSLRMHFEMRDAQTPFMYIFAEPVTDEQIEEIQNTNKKEVEEFERTVLGLKKESIEGGQEGEQDKASKSGWEDIQAKVEAEVENDELSTDMPHAVEEGGPETLQSGQTLSEISQFGPSEAAMKGTAQETTGASTSSTDGVLKDSAVDTPSEASAGHDVSTPPKSGEEEPEILERAADGSDRDADTSFLEELSREQQEASVSDQDRELLAMTLTIRNKVNDQYVLRPENLGPEDRWSVEYDLAEIPTASRSWSLYGACQNRRRSKLEMGSDDSDEAANFFMRRIKELCEKGRAWRKQQDLLDEEVSHTL